MAAAFLRLMERESELLLNMCLFVDKIFLTMRSMGGSDKSLSAEIVDNCYAREGRLSCESDEFVLYHVGPWECSVIMYI